MAKLMINKNKKEGTIAPEIYGHFSEHLGRCIYEGLYVGENSEIPNVNGMRTDVVEALKEIKIPVLRWPGGCFADEYHWKDGIGPKENRKKMINTHWGGVVEDNSFGTHEFFELCRQLGCKTYINGNLGSGTVQEMSEWVEYITFNGVSPMADLRKKNGHEEPWTIDYFGVGNENWGCGGNMRPQYYADEYRRYQTYVRNYDPQKPIQKICGGANVDDYDWTRKVLETTHDHTVPEFHGFMDGLSLHYYVHPEGWEIKGSATDFDEEVWYKTLKKALYMETLVERHGKIMDQYDPDKKIGMIVDEWGCWFTVEPGTNPGFLYQQNTIRDALVAGITLNIFNKHCDRVKMANLAQMVNVLQSVILTEGPKMIKTPTYHVFHMYRHHQGATLLNSTLTGVGETGIGEWKVPEVTESVSEDAEHIITVTLNNLSADEEKEIEIVIAGDEHIYSVKEAKVVSAEMHAHNTFDAPELVKEEVFTAYKKCADGIKIMLPPCSVVELRLQQHPRRELFVLVQDALAELQAVRPQKAGAVQVPPHFHPQATGLQAFQKILLTGVNCVKGEVFFHRFFPAGHHRLLAQEMHLADDHIGPGLPCQKHQVPADVLCQPVVTVHEQDILALCMAQPVIAGVRQAAVGLMDHCDPAVLRRQCVTHRAAVIGAAVIHDEHFQRHIRLRQHRADTALHIVPDVVHRDHDREQALAHRFFIPHCVFPPSLLF